MNPLPGDALSVYIDQLTQVPGDYLKMNIVNLGTILSDNLPLHAPTHSAGATDPITVENLATASVDVLEVLKPDGAGGLVFDNVAINYTNAGFNLYSQYAQATGNFYNISIGYQAYASNFASLAIGYHAYAPEVTDIAIGAGATVYNTGIGNNTAIGTDSKITGVGTNKAIAIGFGVDNSVSDSVSLGWGYLAGEYINLPDFSPTAVGGLAPSHYINITLGGSTYKLLLDT